MESLKRPVKCLDSTYRPSKFVSLFLSAFRPSTSFPLQDVPNYDLDYSELMIYYIGLLEELKEYSEALQVLDVNAKGRNIVDKTAITLMRCMSTPPETLQYSH